MARPVKKRRICGMPSALEFAPCRKRAGETVKLTVDEYEVIRLIDYLGFTQEECAGRMDVSRTTVQSIYEAARKKLADVLVNGKRLEISGGNYDICDNAHTCCAKSEGMDHCCSKSGRTNHDCPKSECAGDWEKSGRIKQ